MDRSGETYGSENSYIDCKTVRIFVIQVRAYTQTKGQWGSRTSLVRDSYSLTLR